MNTPITPLPELAELTSVDTAFQEVHAREETVASVPGVNAVPDLPRRKLGPLTAKKLRTVLITYVTVHFSSLLLLTLDQGNALSAFALGMMAPGGGLWFSGHHLLALLTVALVLVAVTANRYALPGLWLGSALLAALRKARDDERVRAVIVASAHKVFCAGLDLDIIRGKRATETKGMPTPALARTRPSSVGTSCTCG